MRPKIRKPPIFVGGSENCAQLDPPLHERTFPRTLPRKRGRRREAIGMGFAHHCVDLTFHSHMILEISQYPKLVALFGMLTTRDLAVRSASLRGPMLLGASRIAGTRQFRATGNW